MWQLALKDLEQHAKALAIFFTSALALPVGFYLVSSPGADNSGFIGVAFGYIVFGAPTLFAFWLVGQEKVKGTMRLLKLLPIPSPRVILAKALTSLGLCLALSNTTLIIVPSLLRLAGFDIARTSLLTVLWLNLASAFFVAVGIAVFTAFEHKIAMQIAYFGFFVLALAVMIVEKYLTARGVNFGSLLTNTLGQWYLPYWGGIVVLGLAALLILFAGRIFDWAEWSELEEG